MQREYPDRPIVGVGAIIIEGRRVLLARRGNPPRAGQWSLPGGVVELGETLRAATERESLEETGLIVETGQVVEVLDRILPGENKAIQFHYVLIDFLCTCKGGKLQAGGDAAEVAWASEDELEKYKLEQITRDVISKAFRIG